MPDFFIEIFSGFSPKHADGRASDKLTRAGGDDDPQGHFTLEFFLRVFIAVH